MREYSAKEIRAWARANGFEVGTRGRLRREILLAFHDSHAGG